MMIRARGSRRLAWGLKVGVGLRGVGGWGLDNRE